MGEVGGGGREIKSSCEKFKTLISNHPPVIFMGDVLCVTNRLRLSCMGCHNHWSLRSSHVPQ